MRALALMAMMLVTGCGARGEEEPVDAQEVAQAVAAVQVSPGLWESSTEVLSARAPRLPIEMERALKAPRTNRYCISAAAAARPERLGGVIGQAAEGCEVREFAMTQGQLRGRLTCRAGQADAVASEIAGTYGREQFDYRSTVTTALPAVGGELVLEVRNYGRRLGACPAEPRPNR